MKEDRPWTDLMILALFIVFIFTVYAKDAHSASKPAPKASPEPQRIIIKHVDQSHFKTPRPEFRCKTQTKKSFDECMKDQK